MNDFLNKWGEAAYTSTGFFWMALWAFILGYAISSCIQIFITQNKMKNTMGKDDIKSISIATFFGFISSSCSFSALATAKSLFQKGAGFISSIAFLLSSTNLVIELGIVISIFLGWQFVVGEYVGGLLLILISWILIKLINPKKLIKKARKNLGKTHEIEEPEKKIQEKLTSQENWAKVGKQYGMEWKMVWKDVTVGFTIAGIVAIFVPDTFFQTLFIDSGEVEKSTPEFFTLLQHTLVGPIAAFLTFIGSMGNIPLAALLFGKGVSFAGVIAFIFSDLVVFPVLRIHAKYYGWKMSLFILFLLFTSLIITSILLHYGLNIFNALPSLEAGKNIMEQNHFKINYTFFMNLSFIIISALLIYLGFYKGKEIKHHKEMAQKGKMLETILKYLAFICYAWLIIGLFIKFLIL